MTPVYTGVIFYWQGLLSLNGTLEEWVMKSPAEIDAIEAEIRQIRELLSEEE